MPAPNRATSDEIFFEALGKVKGEREAFIAAACGADPMLRTEVESLLAAHERAADFLQMPAAPPGWAGTPIEADSWCGKSVGPYRVERVIGTGGMGTVLLGERVDQQFRKRVAIKVIRVGLATEDVVRRFRTERQVLAQLDHPNIARLIDGGATEDGLPYLVMDYVEGVPIDRYCEERGLTLPDRLRLFRRVCAPVEYAHQHLVVHRDLKPGNILITADGEPKLLDFGIAKVLDPTSDVSLQTTTPTLRLLTPRYASPEHLRGQPVATTTDVYSLGVILYELLTGLLPFDVDPGSVQELERAVTTQEPTRPSTAVLRRMRRTERRDTGRGSGRPSASVSSDKESRRLGRSLAGDLDNVVLMALRKEPQRRYPSVAHFSEDLRRHLAGLPVAARADTVRYRFGKFVLRNRAAAAAVAVLFVGLVFASIISSAMYFRADNAKKDSEAQRATAEQINHFLERMLMSIDPEYARGRDVSILLQVADEAAARIDAELGDLPGVAAALHLTLGNVYAAIASNEEAERHLRRALELRRTGRTGTRLNEAESLLALAQLLRDLSRYGEAEPLFREAVQIRERELGGDDPSVAEALVSFGVHLEHTGQYVEAEAAYRRALVIQEHDPEADDAAFSATLSNLGLYLMYQNREPEAEGPLRRALALRRAAVGDGHLSLVDPLVNLAAWHRRTRRYHEARENFLQAIDICHAHLEPEHPKLLNALSNLAALYQDMGDYQAAEPIYRETLATKRRVHGDLHVVTATNMNNLASLLRLIDQRDEAVDLFAQTVDAYRTVLGGDHYWVSIALHNQGGTLVELNDFAAAEPLLREALCIREIHNAPDWQIADVEVWLAACLTNGGAFSEAEAMLLRGLPALEARDPKSRATRSALTHLVDLYERWNKPDRADEYRERLRAAPPIHRALNNPG